MREREDRGEDVGVRWRVIIECVAVLLLVLDRGIILKHGDGETDTLCVVVGNEHIGFVAGNPTSVFKILQAGYPSA